MKLPFSIARSFPAMLAFHLLAAAPASRADTDLLSMLLQQLGIRTVQPESLPKESPSLDDPAAPGAAVLPSGPAKEAVAAVGPVRPAAPAPSSLGTPGALSVSPLKHSSLQPAKGLDSPAVGLMREEDWRCLFPPRTR